MCIELSSKRLNVVTADTTMEVATMMERPPVWVSFKVADIPNLVGTMIGDFKITNTFKHNGEWYVAMECTTCGKTRMPKLHAVNRAVGRCKHNMGG